MKYRFFSPPIGEIRWWPYALPLQLPASEPSPIKVFSRCVRKLVERKWCTYLNKRWNGSGFSPSPFPTTSLKKTIYNYPPPKTERFSQRASSPLNTKSHGLGRRAADAHSYRSWVHRACQLLALDIPQWPHPWRDQKGGCPRKKEGVSKQKKFKTIDLLVLAAICRVHITNIGSMTYLCNIYILTSWSHLSHLNGNRIWNAEPADSNYLLTHDFSPPQVVEQRIAQNSGHPAILTSPSECPSDSLSNAPLFCVKIAQCHDLCSKSYHISSVPT